MLTFPFHLRQTRQIGKIPEHTNVICIAWCVHISDLRKIMLQRVKWQVDLFNAEVNNSSYLLVKLQIRYLQDLLKTCANYLITFAIQSILDLKNKLVHNTITMFSSLYEEHMKNIEMVTRHATWSNPNQYRQTTILRALLSNSIWLISYQLLLKYVDVVTT